jgi:PhnB protein
MRRYATHDAADAAGVIEAWAAALGAKDAAAVVGHCTPDYVQYSLAPPLRTSPADRGGLQAWFDTWKGPIGYALDDTKVETAGDLAIAHGLCRMSGTKTDGAEVELWFRQTLGLRRTDGAWRIAHQHASVPFYMDGSFRAAIDLKP